MDKDLASPLIQLISVFVLTLVVNGCATLQTSRPPPTLAAPQITSNTIGSDLSLTLESDGPNRFRYSGTPASITLGDGQMFEIIGASELKPPVVQLSFDLDDEGGLLSGILGPDFRILGRTFIGDNEFTGDLLLGEIIDFEYVQTPGIEGSTFNARIVTTAGVLTYQPQGLIRVGQELLISIHQTILDLEFPQTFVLRSVEVGQVFSSTTRIAQEFTSGAAQGPNLNEYDDSDGDDPRDTPPPTIFGEIDECPVCFGDAADVESHDGASTVSSRDQQIPGRPGAMDYVHDRTYRSDIAYNGPMGHNWDFNYNERLQQVTANNILEIRLTFPEAQEGDLLHHNGFARTALYVRNADGSFDSPSGYYTRLDENVDGSFNEYHRHGLVVSYGPPAADGIAQLMRKRDRNANTLTFHYNQFGQLIQVIDELGRAIDYSYNDAGLIEKFVDFLGRVVSYEYDRGDLVSVTSPSVTGTPNGNDFPDGRTRRYRYTHDHKLLEITAPNEVASGGLARVVYVYEAGRVKSLTVGGTNHTGVPAGGTLLYDYDTLSSAGGPNDLTTAVRQTAITDRNGNRTVYPFNQLNNVTQSTEFTRNLRRGSDPSSFESNYQFNKDYEVLEVVQPEGNISRYSFDSSNPDRLQQGNLLQKIHLPGPRGGDQNEIKTTFTYEPLFNQVRSTTSPRGHDPRYRPVIELPGESFPNQLRYTTTRTFDYQEGTEYAALAARLGRTEAQVQDLLRDAGIPMGLGDINNDGITNQLNGNTIRIQSPSVHLLPGSNQAQLEGDTLQEIETYTVYNKFGEVIRTVDPEGNVVEYEYYAENDPDGDQSITPAPIDGRNFDTATGGYLRQISHDTVSAPGRNSGQNPPPTNIRAQFFYDEIGNIIQQVDGRGIATRYFVNELNEVVQVTRAAAVPSVGGSGPVALTAFAYLERMVYDFNGNIVLSQVEERFDTSNTGGFVDTSFRFDILNQKIEKTEEVDVTETLVYRSRYDANGNPVLTIMPEGNATSAIYDERDLLFRITLGARTPTPGTLGAPAGPYNPRGGVPSTITYNYDLNRNLIEKVDAADTDGSSSNGSSVAGAGDATKTAYDGFDRPIRTVDAVGNERIVNYDPVSNIVKQTNRGPVGGSSPTNISGASNVELSIVENQFDELNRNIQRDQELFVSTGVMTQRTPDIQDAQLTPGDDRVTTRMEYDRKSRSTFQIEDDLDTYRMDYDGMDRLINSIDPEGNTVESAYDDNNNVIETRETDVPQVAGIADEIFLTTLFYDSLNRVQQQVDNIGHSMAYRYDSRDNLVAMADSQGPVTGAGIARRFYPNGADTINTINNFGNVSLVFYDGINRVIRTDKILTASGIGSGASPGANIFGLKLSESGLTTVLQRDLRQSSDGHISVLKNWDGNSLLTSLTDDNSNRTDYKYDNLDRQVSTSKGICDAASGLGTLADGCGQPNSQPTTETLAYDPDNNVSIYQDENGSIRNCDFDAINRMISCSINRAAGVIGTTQQTFQYDGLSRLTRATDNNNPAETNDDSIVTVAYDSLSRGIEETQKIGALSAKVISSGWRAENLKTSSIYPNGRIIDFTFDKLDRLNTIRDRGAVKSVADYDYIGIDRVLLRIHEINNTRMTYLDDTSTTTVGYDGLRRPIKLRHLRVNQSLIVGFEHTYDRMNNKKIEQKLHDSTNSEHYAYDSAYRLLNFQRGTLNAGQTAISTPSSNSRQQQIWDLDGAGNWTELTTTESGSSTRENRKHTSFNEISLINDGGVSNHRSHDNNGNLTDEDGLSAGTGIYAFEWDHINRLQRVKRKSDGNVVAVYVYDAFGRRIRKVVTNSGNLNGKTDFYYDVRRVIEERDGGDALTQQYVYGNYIDEVLVLDRNQDGDTTATGTGDHRLFYHQNNLYSVFALTDTSGVTVEGYQYDAYGELILFTPGSNGTVDFGGDDDLTMGRGNAVGSPYMFTGRRLDPETGDYYYRTRYLDPSSGRFTTRDTIGIWQETSNLGNGYTYVASSPGNYLDPQGECKLGDTRCVLYYFFAPTATEKDLKDLKKAREEIKKLVSDMVTKKGKLPGKVGEKASEASGGILADAADATIELFFKSHMKTAGAFQWVSITKQVCECSCSFTHRGWCSTKWVDKKEGFYKCVKSKVINKTGFTQPPGTEKEFKKMEEGCIKEAKKFSKFYKDNCP
jgi:RHS repeat-associated protein